ncbi:hypothetical protein PIB30_113303, partial [Stylosanthes scabra]|nr:hypothetical protein [Stylosanthes scabra]
MSKFFKTHVYALKQVYAWKMFQCVGLHNLGWAVEQHGKQRGVLRICVDLLFSGLLLHLPRISMDFHAYAWVILTWAGLNSSST